MIYQPVRSLKASRWIILAMIFLYVIFRPPRIIVKNGTQKYGEEISSNFDKLISDSNFASKDWTCMKKIDTKWLKPLYVTQIFNSSDPFINRTKLEIYLQRKNGSEIYSEFYFELKKALLRKRNHSKIKSSYDEIFAQDSEYLSGVDFKYKEYLTYDETQSEFMPWTEKSLKKISTLSFQHILQSFPFTRSRLGYNSQNNSMILFNITRKVQLLNDLSDANRYLHYNKLISRSFISKNLKSNPSTTSVKLLQKKNIRRNFYEDYYFNHMPIRTKAKIMKNFFRKLHLILKIPKWSNQIPAGVLARSNNAGKKIYKRQPSNTSNFKSLLGNKSQTCKKDRKAFIFYILLSFAGACCIVLGSVQFWNHRKQGVSKLPSPPRNKIEKIRKNILPTLHQHAMSPSPTRELNFLSQNPERDERNSDLKNASLRDDGVNDTSSFSVPMQKNTSRQKYATFPLCAARSRNLAPTIPELQLPKPSLVSIRRLTGFSSDESSNSGSCADQNPKSSSRF